MLIGITYRLVTIKGGSVDTITPELVNYNNEKKSNLKFKTKNKKKKIMNIINRMCMF